jgi:hypothetical protein
MNLDVESTDGGFHIHRPPFGQILSIYYFFVLSLSQFSLARLSNFYLQPLKLVHEVGLVPLRLLPAVQYLILILKKKI